MPIEKNYFFVDGSSFLSDVKNTRIKLKIDASKKFDILKFVKYFSQNFSEYHSNSYRRFVFYFVTNDERVKKILKLPDFSQPTEVGDIHIQYCGRKIRQTKRATEWLDKKLAPAYVIENLYKSEKAVDTQICCDALQLAATSNLERLFLYTNDFDFTPLCKTLRQLGSNINLFRLQQDKVNKDLASECDAFHVMGDKEIRECYV